MAIGGFSEPSKALANSSAFVSSWPNKTARPPQPAVVVPVRVNLLSLDNTRVLLEDVDVPLINEVQLVGVSVSQTSIATASAGLKYVPRSENCEAIAPSKRVSPRKITLSADGVTVVVVVVVSGATVVVVVSGATVVVLVVDVGKQLSLVCAEGALNDRTLMIGNPTAIKRPELCRDARIEMMPTPSNNAVM
jgi:hypothetical protein